MKTVTFKGTMENAYSKALPAPINFEGAYEAYETIEEVRAANDYPSDKDVVKFRNEQRKANERQKAMQAALDAAGVVKPTLENDAQLRLKKMFDIFVANGNSEEEAKKLASQALNIEWEE